MLLVVVVVVVVIVVVVVVVVVERSHSEQSLFSICRNISGIFGIRWIPRKNNACGSLE